MEAKVKVSTMYNCSLERAFKTPLLCDISKVHTGFGLVPKVTHCVGDENWGQIGSIKKVYSAKSFTQKGGFFSVDKVLERIENNYWKFEVSNFQSCMVGFSRFIGEWKTTEMVENKIWVEYCYTLHSDIKLLYPLNWIFANTLWRSYMKRVLEIVREMACNNEPYKHQ